MKIVKKFKRLLFVIAIAAACFLILNGCFPLKVNVHYSQIVTDDKGKVIHAFLSDDDKWRMMTELNEISSVLRKSLIYKEDKYFYYHFGVNPVAIVRAVFNNTMHLQKTSGASTITMQVARMLNPKKRTYLNKITEMFRAVQLEVKFSKDEILQLYLNLAPYGGNIEGVKAASLLYYGRMPGLLSLAQSVTLTIIPNRPTSLKPGKNENYLVAERNRWLKRMAADNLFSQKEIADAMNEPPDMHRNEAPHEAPHFSLRMKNDFPQSPIIKTNLKKSLQEKIEAISFNHSKQLQMHNVNNASVIVIENKTHHVIAYAGSSDFNDKDHSGQVDGVSALRSPGSTLKPLAYAIAMDKGLITPKKIIEDVPVNYDGYAPENFNSEFNGRVTVEKALSFSLNVPAVKILNDITVTEFIGRLKQADFESAVQNEKKMGLSMILGGCGVRLEELAGLFSCFANEGKYSHLKFLQQDTSSSFTQIISPAAAFMVSDILTQLTRPDLPNNYQSSMHVPKVAWKTGTSYGRRDAWSIGYNKKYTVAVWVGNFNGEGVPELTGADMATPLLFDIFNSIDYNSSDAWFVPPHELDFRLICSESGMPPNDFCSDLVVDNFIPGVSDYKKCNHLVEVNVSPDENISYCTRCIPAAGFKKVLYPNYDGALTSFYKEDHVDFKRIPAHNPNCTRVFKDNPPRITSPVNNKEYLVQKGQSEELQLSCHVSDEVTFVYWYVNDVFYQKAKAHEKIFFTPGEGQIKISCNDDKGRNSDEEITVKFY
ncbi:MAG TPA: penicillin-binding protein 1C [Bacteroidia bacterium]|nr:penicillin-binding protein 1C [Bacteroidia bacterium]